MYAHLIYQSIAKLFPEPGVDPGGGGGGGGGAGGLLFPIQIDPPLFEKFYRSANPRNNLGWVPKINLNTLRK